jgi:hypothetical protein
MMIRARLSKILDEAKSLHCTTEAAQLSDISWLTDEFDALDLPSDQAAVWRARIGSLCNEVYQRLGDFQSAFGNPPAKADESEIADFGRRLEQFGRRLDELWEEIEAVELRFVLAFPEALLGQYAPGPPHLKPLAGNFREAGDLWRRLSAGPMPSGLVDLAAALVDLAGRLNCDPDSAYDATRVAELAVAFLRAAARAQPEASRRRLGTALVVLAQSRLATAEIEEATAAALEASKLVGPDEMPPEVLGLTDPGA